MKTSNSLNFLLIASLMTFGLILSSCQSSADKQEKNDEFSEQWEPNIAYRWAKVVLDATANDTDRFNPRPTITSRYLALITTAMYDAWSRYDDTHHPVYNKDIERRPVEERTYENKEMAISYAIYKTAMEYFYTDTALLTDFMVSLGYDPNNNNLDPTTPDGIGNLVAKNIIEWRKHDGSNHYGEESPEGLRYFNYIGYRPVNTADMNIDVMKWQPKYFINQEGHRFSPECLTPYWFMVDPLFLDSASQFRSPPPPGLDSEQLREEVAEVVEMQANLTDEQRALVEFMRDGPHSVQQAGHWLKFAQVVSARDRHSLKEDVLMYFLNQAAAMDGFIACWDTKMYYDYARPQALVREFFGGETIIGWRGPNQGWGEIDGNDWVPYSPFDFLCPPFPAYTSGHSTVSGACSEILKLYKGNDEFGDKVKLVPGILTELENLGDTVILELPTFTATAELAGISRVLGGYHIQVDNIEGLRKGRRVAQHIWERYNQELRGE
jgi:hypothetical protein